jgi:hypothetical protein
MVQPRYKPLVWGGWFTQVQTSSMGWMVQPRYKNLAWDECSAQVQISRGTNLWYGLDGSAQVQTSSMGWMFIVHCSAQVQASMDGSAQVQTSSMGWMVQPRYKPLAWDECSAQVQISKM